MIETNRATLSQADTDARAMPLVAPVALAVIGAAMLAYYWWGRDLHRFTQWVAAYIGLFIGQLAMYAVACWVTVKLSERASRAGRWATLVIIVFFAIAFRATLAPERPYLSSDVYRYAWDGHVQSAGINPYLYPPDAAELEWLRDSRRFPGVQAIYPDINRHNLPTPYPPAAEATYLLVSLIQPLSVTAFKTAALVFDLITLLAVMLALARARLNPAHAIFFAWHPLPIYEGAHSGHIEAVFMMLLGLALVAWAYKKRALTGIALGLAALVKFYPALVLPAFLESPEPRKQSPVKAGNKLFAALRATVLHRANLIMVGAFVATIIIGYLPYVLSGSTGLGALSNEFSEEGFTGEGARFFPLALIHLFVPVSANVYLLLAVGLLGALGLWWMLKAKRDVRDVACGAAMLVGAYLLLTSPRYSWYYAWILPFVCFAPRLGWLYLTGASVFMYFLWYEPLVYPQMPLWLGAAVYVPTVAWFVWGKIQTRKGQAVSR